MVRYEVSFGNKFKSFKTIKSADVFAMRLERQGISVNRATSFSKRDKGYIKTISPKISF